ncbi:MAG: DUF1599 domain-containing protein [Bacteroidia bacterium]|nr:DUF1599 domain-containing protein [Bacteroidia bacterium]
MATDTSSQYDAIINICRDIFVKKTKDYGTAWRVLRLKSITDQVFIKAQRVRSIDEKGTQKIEEGVESEYIGIINYCVIALIQLGYKDNGMDDLELPVESVITKFDDFTATSKSLMENKNHDYGEAWRDMRMSSFTDLILMKILRIKQIEDNQGETLISEGIDANYYDIMNYSVFAMIHLKFGVKKE